MSSSFCFASSSSFSFFSYAYAFAGASLFLLVLGPHFEDPGRHFSFILASFGATFGTIGCHLDNLVHQRLKMSSSSGTPGQLRCPIWCAFWSIFQPRLNNFFENRLPKTIPQPNALVIWFLSNFSDPRTLIFELSPARERNFQKTSYIGENCKKTFQSGQNWTPK